ncbi:class I SAM-dependent methyltransferase [Micromonospora sonneratiae]|uniref:Class I SAM-dependent methyltransferase n=1 Tax=Micromonospora sonneratiae TaxID=1184706 RepID=A0ABW3YHP7_9ACTN
MHGLEKPPTRPDFPATPDMSAVMAASQLVTGHLAGAMSSLLVVVGLRCGIFAALAASGPTSSTDLAHRCGLDERHLREWLAAMTQAGYLRTDPSGSRFSLDPALAGLLTDQRSPMDLTPGYRLFHAMAGMVEPVAAALRGTGRVAPDAYPDEFYVAMEAMSAGWLNGLLVQAWLPGIDGLVDRLSAGGRMADIGCGGGVAMVALARAFPKCEIVGFDRHGPNVRRARAAARSAGVAGRVRVVEGDAVRELSGPYDLITAFSVLHDVAEPVALLRRARQALADDGVLLVLESAADPAPGGGGNPFATILYATSVLYCLPTSRNDGGGSGTLGLPGERLRRLGLDAGFTSVTPLPTMNPFNELHYLRA